MIQRLDIDLEHAEEASERESRNAAFNQGADARLAGLPITANPFKSQTGRGDEHATWDRGWREVDGHYAELVRGRWRVQKLPRVVQ